MILALLSGGIDSVAMCYMLLQQGHKLHIHHIEIENEENRAIAESIAVKNVLDYFWNREWYKGKYWGQFIFI